MRPTVPRERRSGSDWLASACVRTTSAILRPPEWHDIATMIGEVWSDADGYAVAQLLDGIDDLELPRVNGG